MNAQKTPVALLQEVMMQHAKPLPQYSIVSLPGPTLGFQCTCTVGDIKATATAYSKQEAKHRSAQNILSVLKIPGPVGSPVKINSTPHVNANAVSKLNELASQNGVPYPLYAEVSSGSLRQVSQFAVRCSFGSLEAVGTASNKKEAKQRAASEILVLYVYIVQSQITTMVVYRLKETKLSEIFPKNTITAVASDVASAQDELAGELYKKLSFREREKSNEVQEKCYGTVQTSVVNISVKMATFCVENFV